MNFDEFCRYIKSLDENMSIGIHGIAQNRIDDNTNLSQNDILNKISNDGLKLSSWGGHLSTIKMFGRVKDLGIQDLKELYNYVWQVGQNEEITNILFGFPETIFDNKGNEFYLGHYDKVSGYAKGQKIAGSDFPLNVLFDSIRCVPSDFIIGFIKTDFNNPNIKFIENNNFYRSKNDNQFYDNLYNLLTSKNITNVCDYIKYPQLFEKFNINVGPILDQYQEYLKENNKRL